MNKLETLRKKLEIALKSLRRISRDYTWVEGDYTYNQKYKSYTDGAQIARGTLREIRKIKEGLR
jgi:hypothetical protein